MRQSITCAFLSHYVWLPSYYSIWGDAPVKVFCISDLHGEWDLYIKAIETMNAIAAEEEWHCYCLGDVVDRGEEGYKILCNILFDPRFTLFRGNHEELFLDTLEQFSEWDEDQKRFLLIELQEHPNDAMSWAFPLYAINGGTPTFMAWLRNPRAIQGLRKKLRELPLRASYSQYDMCHSGCSIEEWDNSTLAPANMIWNRAHFDKPWKPNRILVFGHTPVITNPDDPTSYKVWHNQDGTIAKINIDAGAHWTKRLALLELASTPIPHIIT